MFPNVWFHWFLHWLGVTATLPNVVSDVSPVPKRSEMIYPFDLRPVEWIIHALEIAVWDVSENGVYLGGAPLTSIK